MSDHSVARAGFFADPGCGEPWFADGFTSAGHRQAGASVGIDAAAACLRLGKRCWLMMYRDKAGLVGCATLAMSGQSAAGRHSMDRWWDQSVRGSLS